MITVPIVHMNRSPKVPDAGAPTAMFTEAPVAVTTLAVEGSPLCSIATTPVPPAAPHGWPEKYTVLGLKTCETGSVRSLVSMTFDRATIAAGPPRWIENGIVTRPVWSVQPEGGVHAAVGS